MSSNDLGRDDEHDDRAWDDDAADAMLAAFRRELRDPGELGDGDPDGELDAFGAGGLTLDPELVGEADASEDADADDEPIELSEREEAERRVLDETDWRDAADRVLDELMERAGEQSPEPRLGATRRACELLGDVHRCAPVVHLTGTNGKTSTARIVASFLGAHGLRAGLLTSPHLERFNERIEIEGEPIADERLASVWAEVRPFVELVDAELERDGQVRLTFFEAMTVLAFACFADAPVDVMVLEVGMGGEWDATNVADGDVAVFTPIGLDHASRLGSTLEAIARTKAGIIKPAARVVSAAQEPEVLAELEYASRRLEAELALEGRDFELVRNVPEGPAARALEVRGLAGTYAGVLPLRGEYQGHNAAVAIAAVEAFFGGGQTLRPEVVEQGLVAATSPGRLQRLAQTPPVYIDAAHNPHGAAALAGALRDSVQSERLLVVLGVLDDKDAEGIVRALAPVASAFIATQSESPRAIDAFDLAATISEATGTETPAFERSDDAIAHAIELAAADTETAVLVTGTITLLGDAMRIVRDEEWGTGRA